MKTTIFARCLTRKTRKYATAMGLVVRGLNERDCRELTIMAGASLNVFDKRLIVARKKERLGC